MSDFNSPCNDAEVLFLEALSREHPKEIKVVTEQKNGARSVNIQILSESLRNYVIWMLDNFRRQRDALEEIFNIPDWEYET